jgi:hypothetical protein
MKKQQLGLIVSYKPTGRIDIDELTHKQKLLKKIIEGKVLNPNPEESDDHCQTCTCNQLATFKVKAVKPYPSSLNGTKVWVVIFSSGGVLNNISVKTTEKEAQELLKKEVGMPLTKFYRLKKQGKLPEEIEDFDYWKTTIGELS